MVKCAISPRCLYLIAYCAISACLVPGPHGGKAKLWVHDDDSVKSLMPRGSTGSCNKLNMSPWYWTNSDSAWNSHQLIFHWDNDKVCSNVTYTKHMSNGKRFFSNSAQGKEWAMDSPINRASAFWKQTNMHLSGKVKGLCSKAFLLVLTLLETPLFHCSARGWLKHSEKIWFLTREYFELTLFVSPGHSV